MLLLFSVVVLLLRCLFQRPLKFGRWNGKIIHVQDKLLAISSRQEGLYIIGNLRCGPSSDSRF